MTDFLFMLASFIVAISLLIAVHEFGHFWVAKKLGVKVLRYSIGFGRPLWSKRVGVDQTEYVIAALPLGGYVKMLDEREGDVPAHELPRAFNRQHVAKRFAIVAAGPVFNFLFAILAYWGMFIVGLDTVKPVVGEVIPDTPAAIAGLKKGDQIISIDQQEMPVFEMATEELFLGVLERRQMSLQVQQADGALFNTVIDLQNVETDLKPQDMFKAIGFYPWTPPLPAIIGQVVDGSPAADAGLQNGDEVRRIDDQEIGDWHDLVKYVRQRPGKTMSVTVERNGAMHDFTVTAASVSSGDEQIGQLGVVNKIQPSLPEEMKINYQYPLLAGLSKGLTTMWDKTVLSLKLFGKLITGVISAKNLSGPIGIAQHAGASASAGLPWFLGFLAIVSINLGILNLLPVPILDGGHLLFYIIESIKGSPVSETVEMIGQRIGIALLLTLMMLAFYNDIVRIFEK